MFCYFFFKSFTFPFCTLYNQPSLISCVPNPGSISVYNLALSHTQPIRSCPPHLKHPTFSVLPTPSPPSTPQPPCEDVRQVRGRVKGAQHHVCQARGAPRPPAPLRVPLPLPLLLLRGGGGALLPLPHLIWAPHPRPEGGGQEGHERPEDRGDPGFAKG